MADQSLPTGLYIHATIITVNITRDVITDGAILVGGSTIIAIGPSDQLVSQYKVQPDLKVVDLQHKIVIPGLINTHAHLAQSLLRGLAEELNLHDWLCSAIWPLEASFQGDDGYVAARLTLAEMLLSGTTTFLEAMITHTTGFENVLKAVGENGMRGCLGKLVKPRETNTASGMVDARDKDVENMSVESAIDAHQRYDDSFHGRVKVWLALGTPRGNNPSFHSEAARAAKGRKMGITMHCAEAPKDLDIYREHYGSSPMEFCIANHISGPKTVLAHMVNLDLEQDIPLLVQSHTSIAHNPSSNCKLGSGIAAVPALLSAGVNVSLGTDGAPCANTYDMIREMNLACLLQSGLHQSAGILSATTALEMATINAARALGLDDRIGSLEVGKRADFVVVNPYTIGSAATPWDAEQLNEGGIDPVTVVVHSCTGRDVEMVVVDGKVLVRNGRLVNGVDEKATMEEARSAIRGIRKRSGVKAGSWKGKRDQMKTTAWEGSV